MNDLLEDGPEIRLGYHFTAIPDALIDDRRVSIQGKAAYLVIARHADKSKRAFPSLTTIGEKAGCSRSSAQRAIRELERLGWLEKQNRLKEGSKEAASNLYTLRAEPLEGIVTQTIPMVRGTTPIVPQNTGGIVTGTQEVDPYIEVDTRKEEEQSESSSSPYESFIEDVEDQLGLHLEKNPATRELYENAAKRGIANPDYVRFVWGQERVKKTVPYLIQSLRARDYEEAFLATLPHPQSSTSSTAKSFSTAEPITQEDIELSATPEAQAALEALVAKFCSNDAQEKSEPDAEKEEPLEIW